MNKLILLITLMFMGCASVPEPMKSEHGSVVPVETPQEVLKVMADNPDANIAVTANDDGYLVFVNSLKKVPDNPIVIQSGDLTELKILLNQYVADGWKLSGSISVSNVFGKVTYYATLLK